MKLRYRIRSLSIALCLVLPATLLPLTPSSAATQSGVGGQAVSDGASLDEPSVECPPVPPPGVPYLPCPPIPIHEPDEEELLVLRVGAMVDALQSYADENGTYQVDGTGFKGRGTGWASYEEPGSDYPVSIARVLTAEGHLPATPGYFQLSLAEYDIARDVLVYLCKDRVGVFTLEGEGEPSAQDSAWWTENDCFRYPIDRLNATHFQLSDELPGPGDDVKGIEALRAIEVDKMVAGLESYADANGTYRVEGAGFRGFGTGWAFYAEAGTDYAFSIASALRSGGHLPPDAAPTFGDVLVYRCKDRVGVFTTYDSLAPSEYDSTWWATNECAPYPLVGLGATYFSLSKPLPQ